MSNCNKMDPYDVRENVRQRVKEIQTKQIQTKKISHLETKNNTMRVLSNDGLRIFSTAHTGIKNGNSYSLSS